MEDLFNFQKNEVIKTNEKLSFKASKKQKTKDLKASTRDENFKVLNDKNLFEHHKDWMSELTDLV